MVQAQVQVWAWRTSSLHGYKRRGGREGGQIIAVWERWDCGTVGRRWYVECGIGRHARSCTTHIFNMHHMHCTFPPSVGWASGWCRWIPPRTGNRQVAEEERIRELEYLTLRQ